MVLESWESVQARQIVALFFRECIFSARAKRMPLNGCRGAHGRLRFINQVLIDSKRVVLSVGYCLES